MAQLIKGVVDTQIENLRPIGSTNAGDDTVIELSIKSNGQDFIFNNPTFELLSKKADNTKTRQIKDITLIDGIVKIKSDIQLILCEGIVTNQLFIKDGDKISTVYFYFNVNKSLENEVLEESKDKIESLDKLDQLINVSFDNLEAYENKLLAFSMEMDSIVEVESKREANELIRSTSEIKRISNEDSRIISEEDRIANEAIRVENEESRGLAESERVINENNRRLAENTRKTQENARVAAEEQRQSIFEENENIRKEQEGKRVQAESVRKNKFDTWEEREGIRLISEDQRREAEESRELAESNRNKAEKVREQQEANRQSTYNRFNSGEEERVNNENSRKDKENLRVLAENSRVAAEEERVVAENTRNSRYETAESNRNNTFNSNENKRQSDYESNEGSRNSTFEAEERKRKNSYQDAENTRNNSFNQQEENRQNEYTVAERLRVENENLRKNNEVTRGSNEETRKSNETSRVSAENIRVENEKTRVAAEEERQANFEKIKTDNTTFKEEVKAQYDNIVNENNNFKNEMNKDYGNAKVDYFGEEHLNVVNRLNSDFDNVHQRINDSSYLEYSGATIKADNSYFGLTKDLKIKGRTLQNLIDVNKKIEYTATKPYDGWSPLYLSNLRNNLIKPNTKYTIIAHVLKFPNTGVYNLNQGEWGDCAFKDNMLIKSTGIFKFVQTTTSDITNVNILLRCQNLSAVGDILISNFLILEGDHTNTPIEELSYGNGIYLVGENENNLINVMSKNKIIIPIPPPNKKEECFIPKGTKVSLKPKNNIPSLGGNITLYEQNGNIVWVAIDKGATNASIRYLSNDIYYIRNGLASGVEYELEIGKEVYPTIPYQESIINYQLTEPLRKLPNGICDEIIGNELVRRVGKIVLNGSEDWWISSHSIKESTLENYIGFKTKILNCAKRWGGNGLICDKFKCGRIDSSQYSVEHIYWGTGYNWMANLSSENDKYDGGYVAIGFDKTTLSSSDVTGLKKWLQANPTTVYYELDTPIITKLDKKAELKTFEGTTHFTSNNKLLPSLSVKVPTNVQAVLQDTRARNRELENELETTTLKLKEADNILKEMDTDLIKTNWEMDDRLFEVEWALEDAGLVTPVSAFNINNKMRGSASVMALSKFEQAKIIIMSGDYDRVTLEGQLSKYLKRNIIAQDEYDTLISMMDAKEIVVGE